MRQFLIHIIFVLFSGLSFAQIVITQPEFPTQNDSIVITFDATQPGAEELLNYSGTVYAHTGVNTNVGDWQHVIGDWGQTNQPALIRLGTNLYQLTVGYPRQFYGLTNPSEHILELAIVFRSSDGNLQTRPDIFIPIYEPGLNIVINNPKVNNDFGDPLRSPAFLEQDSSLNISFYAVQIGTQLSNLSLFIDGSMVSQTTEDTLNFVVNYSEYLPGALNIDAIGTDTSGTSDTSSFVLFVNPNRVNQTPPAGTEPGINYNSATSITLMLQAPDKNFVYVIGDFNDWKVETNYFLKRFATGPQDVYWWITLNGISPGTEYAFQYLVDGNIRIGDPYGHKVLDPSNDQYISPETYPNLKPYPQGKTDHLVTTFQTGVAPYQWNVTDFQRPAKTDLVIYELLVRDFLAAHDYKTLTDTLNYLKNLGVNAIEIMPVMEFEGNESWGYNPSFHLALDKYYGPSNDLKAFIDSAHANGIAIILDIVLNHAYGQSPLVRLYWDEANNRPAANNPWFNVVSPNPVYSFGYDFNHENQATKYFVNRVNRFWLSEFNIDGFRFDFTKGFTNTPGDGSNYDQSRVDILESMADSIWAFDSSAYIILEHFVQPEEGILGDYGMLLWYNMNYNYNEATMGYTSDLSGISYKYNGWTSPHHVHYMESHDEERLMYKNLQFGNSNGNYNIKQLPTALQRIKLAAAFYFTVPGPKMIWQFGELGYDISIDYPCRVCNKPIKWEYFSDINRLNLYKVFSYLINLKKDYDAFRSDDFSISLTSYLKRININHPSMNVTIIGNFNVTPGSINPTFQQTGWWYDYFSGDSILVNNVTDQISLEPGEFHIYTTVKLPTPEPGILLDVNNQNNALVNSYELEQNYPNPFNPSTKIKFAIPNSEVVSIKVYDILGREIRTLLDEELTAGFHEIEFNASNLSSGIYFYRIESGSFIKTKKMILLK